MKIQKTTMIAFLIGAAVTAGGTSLYLTRAGIGMDSQQAVSPLLFPKSPMPSITPVPSPAPKQVGLDDVATMIGRLAKRLEENPDNPEGWRMLGWSYLATEQAQKAVEAYANAIDLKGDVAQYRSAYGEALVKAANGTVTPVAMTAFNEALSIDTADVRARYFVGLAKRQGGDAQGAYDIWITLMKDTPQTESFIQDLRSQMASLSQELGMNVPSDLPPDRAVDSLGGNSKISSAMPATQMGRIRGMVEGLAQRLKESPDDGDGWRMLGKSYGVLGNHKESIQAYARLVALRPNDSLAHRRHAEAVLKTVASGEPYPTSLSGSLKWLHRSNPKDEFALYHLGESNSRAGNKDLATKYWHSLLAVVPQNSPMRVTVGSKLQALTETRMR